MPKPKYAHYELKLSGDADLLAFLKPHLPDRFGTIAEANAKKRAIVELFGIEAQIISVRRIPARTRRRVLRM